MPIYYTTGNHEIDGVLAERGMDISHPLWGKGMYEKMYGKSYHSFMYAGRKFFVLEGHTHLYMNLLFEGIHYISGGSTSYTADLNKNSDGFIFVKIRSNKEDIKFINSDRLPSKNN
jgi:hypothetical protein